MLTNSYVHVLSWRSKIKGHGNENFSISCWVYIDKLFSLALWDRSWQAFTINHTMKVAYLTKLCLEYLKSHVHIFFFHFSFSLYFFLTYFFSFVCFSLIVISFSPFLIITFNALFSFLPSLCLSDIIGVWSVCERGVCVCGFLLPKVYIETKSFYDY